MSSKIMAALPIQDFDLWRRLRSRRALISFNLELTARCNNNCSHCYINLPAEDTKARCGELSRAEINDIANEAVSLGALWCLITGGEPLLRADFPDIYLDLKKKGLLVSVFTNATLIDENVVRLFREYPPRDMEISVYGITAETYEKVTRKPGSFARFNRGVRMLLDAGVKVRFKAMALRNNIHEIAAISRFYRERSTDFFRFDPYLHLRHDGTKARNDEIKAQRLAPAEVVALERSHSPYFQRLAEHCVKLMESDEKTASPRRLFYCGVGRNDFTLGWDGIFRLCSALHHPEYVYNLRKGNLTDAWLNFAPEALERITDDLGRDNCHTCSYLNLCFWCPAHSFLENGSLNAPVEDFCSMVKARVEALRQDVCADTVEEQRCDIR